MCGFTALFQIGRTFAPDLLDGIERDLLHRGPDSGGQLNEPGRALVFRRLSILDTRDDADQPMTDPSGRFTLVYNGEIYNFKALRRELEAAGHVFRTTGDTEVVLRGFAHWGEGVLGRLEGMYAFVLVDRHRGKVVAARDPHGIKPLYLLRRGGLTAFASEMRPLRRLAPVSADTDALAELLLFRFAAGRLSNLKGIDRLPGGTLVELDLESQSYRERRFADVLDTLSADRRIDPETARGVVADGVRSSVREHLQSDVGYAVQLSGGIDSSIVTALTTAESGSPPLTFGIELGDTPHDEGPYRERVVNQFGSDHHELSVDGTMFADALPRAVGHMEGPSPHLGCVLLMLLCDEIRKHTKVVLTGEGADELFGGYDRYGRWCELRKHELFAHSVPGFLWPLLHRYRALENYRGRDVAVYATVLHDYFRLLDVFPGLLPKPGAREAASRRFHDFRDRLMAVDQTAYLESLLLRQDKMAMSASVEARVPFTHFPLTRSVNRIPQNIRVPGITTKPLLKGVAERYFDPEFVHRRKVGLTLPLEDWLAQPRGLGRYLDDLTAPNARLALYADRPKLRRLVEDFRKGDRRLARVLTHLINLEIWLREVDMPMSPTFSAGCAMT